ncbi:Cwh43 protein [Martiniozyma asiatica (nom. inval.)]|nr:Cwh43 protein [Martiniozyma asiatica]
MVAESKTPLLRINAEYIAWAHTICASTAFVAALAIGYSLHFYKIVKNEHFGYPQEWWPSVSATIGDRYPERSVFQILIALTSGPRFLLLFFSYLRLHKSDSSQAMWTLIVGLVRTVTCGGWVYITSTDDHDWHDIFMILYIVLTLPWDIGITKLSPPRSSLRRYRKYTAWAFFLTLVPLIYLFIQHKVHHVPGSYSYYAYCEWGLIVLDIAFDSWCIVDFKDLYVEIRPTNTSDEFFSINLNLKTIKNKIDSETLIEKDTFTPKSQEFNSTYLHLLTNIINSFIFWSVLTSLFVCVWYFPLWFMGISGYELVILSTFSPIILSISKVKKFFTSKPSISRLLCCILGIGSYIIVDPITRLFLISFGNAFGFISLACEISSVGVTGSASDIKSYAGTFLLGLILSSISKFAFWTNNPIWPIMNKETGGWNGTGLVIGTIAAYYTTIPNSSTKTASTNDVDKPSALVTAAGFGSLLFSMFAMMTDSSTIILWVWDGYPVDGPVPVPHGAISLVVMCLGLYWGIYNDSMYRTITYSGILGATLLYFFHGWIGYIGGLAYIFWMCFVTPMCFVQMSYYYNNIAKVFTLSIIFTIILTLMHVWIVAYAFVPGGPLLRERTDIVLGSSVFLLCTLVFKSTKLQFQELKIQQSIKKFGNIIVCLLFASMIIAFNRFQFTPPKPLHPDSRLVTAGIWTIHFGLDNDMWASEHRMRDLIRDAELDIVGLLESDTQRIIMGNRDLTQRLAEELGMYADFGPGPNKHTWGAALLSRFPILKSTHHLLPSPVGELAPAIHATLDMYGTEVDVVVFHSGQEEDEEDRRLQSLYLQELMGSSDRPMILLSYLVTDALKGNYNTYVSEKSGMHDIDATDDQRWCEYILYKKMKRTGYARISRGSITDTELQVGKFVVPYPDTIDEEYSQKRISESSVPEDMRFPSIFYGEGVREHQFLEELDYEPRYFL